MTIVLRTLMVLGMLLILLSVVTGMGSEGAAKPAHSRYLMTSGLVSLGLWIVGGIAVNFLAKDPSEEIEAKLAANEAARRAEKQAQKED